MHEICTGTVRYIEVLFRVDLRVDIQLPNSELGHFFFSLRHRNRPVPISFIFESFNFVQRSIVSFQPSSVPLLQLKLEIFNDPEFRRTSTLLLFFNNNYIVSWTANNAKLRCRNLDSRGPQQKTSLTARKNIRLGMRKNIHSEPYFSRKIFHPKRNLFENISSESYLTRKYISSKNICSTPITTTTHNISLYLF